jgi:hypothetical protein
VVAPPAAAELALGRAVLAALPLNSCQPPFFAMPHPEPLVPILVGAAPENGSAQRNSATIA